jgi:hypothetical protein
VNHPGNTSNTQYYGWTTSAELAFIDGLAQGRDAEKKLRGYLIGMSKRTNFGDIDAFQATQRARELLALVQKPIAA